MGQRCPHQAKPFGRGQCWNLISGPSACQATTLAPRPIPFLFRGVLCRYGWTGRGLIQLLYLVTGTLSSSSMKYFPKYSSRSFNSRFYILYEQQFHLTPISASPSQRHQAKTNAANTLWGHPEAICNWELRRYKARWRKLRLQS